MRGLADTAGREFRAAGVGEWLAAVLLISAFYLEPIAGGAPWQASLVLTCLAGGVLVLARPDCIRRVPLIMVGYTVVYVLTALIVGYGSGSEVARYIVRPVALVALSLFLVNAASRRRVMVLVVGLAAPQVLLTLWQAVEARVDYGAGAVIAADSVSGTFGDYGAAANGLVALAALCLLAGLVLTRRLDWRWAVGLGAAFVALEIFTATRAAVVFLPATALGLVGAVVLARGRAAPGRTLGGILLFAALSAPVIYGATETLYPGAFTGAFSNQESLVLGDGRALPDGAGDDNAREGEAYNGPRGVAVLPGRVTQIRRGVKISVEDGPRIMLLGRGFGAAAVPEDAVIGSSIPKEQETGSVWIGRVLGDAGWLGLLAFLALIGWLAWLGIRIVRSGARGADMALGFALPGFAVLTLCGATYTTILDIRPYSAVFIVLAAAGFAAARDISAGLGEGARPSGNGRRALASTPLPPRQQETSPEPSATSARSS